MTRFVVGELAGFASLAPLVYGVRRFRRARSSLFRGATGVLADVAIVISVVIGVSEALGTIGLFRTVPVAIAFALTGIGAAAISPRASRTAPAPIAASSVVSGSGRASRPLTRLERGLTAGAIALVAAEWAIRTIDTAHRGIISTADTLWYHLPLAARFAHEGWTSRLHFVDAHSLIVFYPANSELLHATGILFVGNDYLSPLINLGWLALALIAAWSIGQTYGVPVPVFLGSVLVLATPELVLDDAGSALNDVVGLALFLTAIALVTRALEARAGRVPGRTELLAAALAVGLALGTKYTMAIPAVALTIAVIACLPKGARVRRGSLWIAGVAATGGYWYLRNLLHVGNPVPSLSAGIGPVRLPSIPFPGTSSVANSLFNASAWRHFLLPGLNEALGPTWWALLVLAGAGMALGIARAPSAWRRWIAIVAFLCAVGYVFSPQILGTATRPIYFGVNVRYAALALILGLSALATTIGPKRPRLLLGVASVEFAAVLAMQTRATIWRHGRSDIAAPVRGTMPAVVAAIVGALVLLVAALVLEHPSFLRAVRIPVRTAAAAALTFVVLAGIGAVEQHYRDNRFDDPSASSLTYSVARHLTHARIGTVNVSLTYPLYGPKLSNHVDYLALRSSNGKSTPITTCRAWKTALRRGRYDYVVIANPGFPFPAKRTARESTWTQQGGSARLVATESRAGAVVSLFRVLSPPDVTECR